MDKSYRPADIESRWYQVWEERGYFAPRTEGAPYCILLPPPNITGNLHMGHGFQHTLMDILVRCQRMRGRRVLWQGGTDHAGIATQIVVERQLEAKGLSRESLGRDKFIERVWDWKEHSGNTITRQMRRLGVSLDWSRERFTMDAGLSQAVREVFIRLYEAGYISRGKRLVNWDPVLETAVSDLEVIAEEENGHLWHFRYPLSSGEGRVVVATTRPETMLGDTAVAVHPEDARFRHLVGQHVRLPLTGREIPIIADEHVDPAFGSGCVKVTPAHDFNDYTIGLRHGLPMISIFTQTGTLNDEVPLPYQGLDRFTARKQVIADMEAAGLLEKTEEHCYKVPRGDRSATVLEPRLTDQWFVQAERMTKAAVQAVESGEICFVPDHWKNTYFAWMREIQDWCISRQLWWGHRIPAWYGPDGKIYVGHDEADVRAKYSIPAEIALRQDEDVLDTWFSSALWSFSTLGWPGKSTELAMYHPTAVLITGFDIIFFWVARMIMMSTHFLQEIPFHEVYVTGLVRDAEGRKMSKSEGNILDPIDLIDGIGLEELVTKRTQGLMQSRFAARTERNTRREFPKGIPAHGADALRFSYCALATTTRDIRFSMGRVEGYRNFCNKLWNAARYVITQVGDVEVAATEKIERGIAGRWVLSRLQQTEQAVNDALAQYRFDLVARALHEFAWHEYCDWYLETSKLVLSAEESDSPLARGTRYTLVQVLETLLRLAHPVMPFLTEEIWQRLKPLSGCRGESIMLEPFPEHDADTLDTEAEAEMQWLQNVVNAVRTIRGEMRIMPATRLPLLLCQGEPRDRERAAEHEFLLRGLARLESIDWLEAQEDAPPAATALVGNLEILVKIEGLIDRGMELARLGKEITRLEQEVQRAEGKLQKQSFAERAPADIVARVQEQLAQNQAALVKLRRQRKMIENL